MPWLSVAWKTAVWLFCNLLVQGLPIVYLWLHNEDKPKALWQYVNSSLALLIAIGMLAAAISDVITERGKIGVMGWLALVIMLVMSLAALHRAVHDEHLMGANADWEVFLGSMVVGSMILVVGSFVKAKMWYDEAVKESAGPQ